MVALLLVACLVLVGAVVALTVTVTVSLRRHLDAVAVALAVLRTEQADVGRRVARLEEAPDPATAPQVARQGTPTRRPVREGAADEEFVITRLGSGEGDGDVAPLEPPDARLFADLVLRESVVKAAALAHGVRRGLSPANRNRIWFEMRREVKRARKDRKAEEREAIREWRARQRAAVREDSAA